MWANCPTMEDTDMLNDRFYLSALSLVVVLQSPFNKAAASDDYQMDDGVVINANNWMTDIFITQNKNDVKLREMLIPGTHDSATHGIEPTSGSADPDDCGTPIMAYGSAITSSWAKAQSKNILEQLNDGIRYLDLRLTWDDEVWIEHCFKSVKFSDVLTDIKTFAELHPNEIVIVDVQSIKMGSEKYVDLVAEINATFPVTSGTQHLIDVSSGINTASTIKQLQGYSGSLLFLFGKNAVADMDTRFHRRADFLEDDYANTDDPDELFKKLKNDILPAYDTDKLTKVQTVLTPQTSTIVNAIVVHGGGSASSCVIMMAYCPAFIVAWAAYEAAAWLFPSISVPLSLEELSDEIKNKVLSFVKKFKTKGLRTNIVIADFYEKTDIVEYAIQQNYNSNNTHGRRLAQSNDYIEMGSSHDFNNDGFDDMVINNGFADVDGLSNAGEITILYGKAGGFANGAYREQNINQNTPGIPGVAEKDDFFGYNTATGDFNNDGYGDLVISHSNESINMDNGTNHQALLALGIPASDIADIDSVQDLDKNWWLTKLNEIAIECTTQQWDQAQCESYVMSESTILQNNISANIINRGSAGAVTVIYGGANGLDLDSSQQWHLDSLNVIGSPAHTDRFGSFLSTGDFNNDGFVDIAISAEGRDVMLNNGTTSWSSGAVFVLYGSNMGITGNGSQELHMGDIDSGLAGTAANVSWMDETGTGDVNGDGFDDLVISAEFYKVNAINNAGAFVMVYGSSNGLDILGSQLFDRSNLGGVIASDYFGGKPTLSDINNDGYADLAISSSYNSTGNKSGAVTVVYGSNNGLNASNWQEWHQNVQGIQGVAEHNMEDFGTSTHLADINEDGFADLLVGVSSEDHDILGTSSDGVLHIIFGSANGLTATGNLYLHQDHIGQNVVENYDYFASGIFTGDFDGNGHLDIVIGSSGEDVPSANNQNEGTLHILMQNNGNGIELNGFNWIK